MKHLKEFALLFFGLPYVVVGLCCAIYLVAKISMLIPWALIPWLTVAPWLLGWAVICALVVWATPREGT